MKLNTPSLCMLALSLASSGWAAAGARLSSPVVDTGQAQCYSDDSQIHPPSAGQAYYGQDAQYAGHAPQYRDHGDGTVSDVVTGLMWSKSLFGPMPYADLAAAANRSRLGGYDDWRVPDIKELYSLIQFTGRVSGQHSIRLFIDTDYFEQPLGDRSQGQREIDAQTWSSTEYVGRTMRDDRTVFGVNFIDGRIKGYPMYQPRSGAPHQLYLRMVRGNPDYGGNRLSRPQSGVVVDAASGLMWQQADSGQGMDWQAALAYAQGLQLGGYSDWRLPNAKELQSIVDYTRSPQTSHSAAIDPIFQVSELRASDGSLRYPYYWSSTTHQDGRNPYASAVYLAFGRALGEMHGRLMDVHGAGAQRSDPKSNSGRSLPYAFGPQGDLRYVYNYVRCVRDVSKRD